MLSRVLVRKVRRELEAAAAERFTAREGRGPERAELSREVHQLGMEAFEQTPPSEALARRLIACAVADSIARVPNA